MTSIRTSGIAALSLLALGTVSACGSDDNPLGAVEYVSQDELDALAESGDLMEAGEIDPAAERARRQQAEVEAEAIIDAFLVDHPEAREQLLWEVDSPSATRLPDGNHQVEIPATGQAVVLQGVGWERRSDASVIQQIDDPAAHVGILSLLHPIVPDDCRALAPTQSQWETLSVDELIEVNNALADCWQEWRTFAQPFDNDNVEPERDQIRPPAETGTCDKSFPILAGGGNDGAAECSPSNPMVSGFAFRDALSPVRNQANRGTCVAFGTAAAIEYAVGRTDGERIDITEQSLYSLGKFDLYGEHFGDGLPTADFIDEMADRRWPIMLETSWGYNPSPCRTIQGEYYVDSCSSSYENAACSETTHQLGLYAEGPGEPLMLYRPVDLRDGQFVRLRDSGTLPIFFTGILALELTNAYVDAGAGVVAAMRVTDDFMNAGPDGFLPNEDDSNVGGHAVQLVRVVHDGAAPGGAWVVIKNSWGCGWGDNGYAYLSAEWFLRYAKSISVLVPERVVYNTPPSVTITSLDAFTVEPTEGFGNSVTLSASVTDAEQGDDCCSVAWHSDIDGPLGTGNPVQVTLRGEGIRELVATVRDDHGVIAQDSVRMRLTNQAPEPEIIRPLWVPGGSERLGQRIPRGARVPLSGVASDPNKIFDVPCDRQSWTVTDPDGNDTDTPGCSVNPRLDDLGWYRVVYEARDAAGATGSDNRWLRVVDWRATDLPYLAISNPPVNDFVVHDREAVLTLTAETGSGTGVPPTVRWIVTYPGGEAELGSGRTIQWTPSDDVPDNCGGNTVEIRAEATDANGTSIDALEVYVAGPLC